MRDVLMLLVILAVAAILFVAAVVATQDDDLLADVEPDTAGRDLPPGHLLAEDIRALRFGMALRGYRMDEVDLALQRLGNELSARDGRISELERALADIVTPLVEQAEAAPPPQEIPVSGLTPTPEPEPAPPVPAPAAWPPTPPVPAASASPPAIPSAPAVPTAAASLPVAGVTTPLPVAVSAPAEQVQEREEEQAEPLPVSEEPLPVATEPAEPSVARTEAAEPLPPYAPTPQRAPEPEDTVAEPFGAEVPPEEPPLPSPKQDYLGFFPQVAPAEPVEPGIPEAVDSERDRED